MAVRFRCACSPQLTSWARRSPRSKAWLPGGLHPVQQAGSNDVAQCGFCQPGQIMQAAALLKTKPSPSDADIDEIMNVCRCGTYCRIRKAIKRAASSTNATARIAADSQVTAQSIKIIVSAEVRQTCGVRRWSTRSTHAASPTATVTGSGTCQALPRGSRICGLSVWMRCG